MKPLRPAIATVVAALLCLALASCDLVPGVGGDDNVVHRSTVEPTPLDLPVPTYALATPAGLLVRAGDQQRTFRGATAVEWLPDGHALLYFRNVVRLWDPATGDLGARSRLGEGKAQVRFIAGSLKRSVTQISSTIGPNHRHPDLTRLAAFTPTLEAKWTIDLPGPDNDDPDAGSGSGFVRSYRQGHTIGGTTWLMWSDFDPNGEESDPHYGLLRVGEDGEVLGTAQVNARITSTWLSSDGAALLALRRVKGHPCGGCSVTLELVELDPATGEVVGEYGMPEAYDKDWDVVEVDKVGDRVAIRLFTYPEPMDPDNVPDDFSPTVLGGTWIRDDDGWSLLEGSKDEVTWWQGPDDKVVARIAGQEFRYFWVHDGEEEPLRGRLEREVGPEWVIGGVPGSALPPA